MNSSPRAPEATSRKKSLGDELWRFALAFYGRDGVAPACLALQDRLGLDVDILLVAIFAAVERDILLDTGDLTALDDLVSGWRAEIVWPLRRLRSRLKSGPSPAPSPLTEELRARIKADEIEAERVELAMLAGWLQGRPPSGMPDKGQSVPFLVARHFAAGRAGLLDAPEIRDALQAIDMAIGNHRTLHSA